MAIPREIEIKNYEDLNGMRTCINYVGTQVEKGVGQNLTEGSLRKKYLTSDIFMTFKILFSFLSFLYAILY